MAGSLLRGVSCLLIAIGFIIASVLMTGNTIAINAASLVGLQTASMSAVHHQTSQGVRDADLPAVVHSALATAPPANTTRAPADASSTAASGYSSPFAITFGYNPEFCGVQPNRTTIDPYVGCPVPGMNNILYTQHNRWFCAYRERRMYQLRDRICNKGTQEPYRYSTVLQIKYDRLPGDRRGAALCWSDIGRQDELPHCSWKDIPRFYGTSLWWEARALIDFHPSYHEAAERFIAHRMHNARFVGVHLRRGDYLHHCTKIQRKGIKPWVTFQDTKTLRKGMSSCFPDISQIEESLRDVKARFSAKYVFVATNVPEELDPIRERLDIVTLHDPEILAVGSRRLDYLIFEMAIMAKASAFIFNRYSSLSATVFEMAVVAKKANNTNVMCW